MKALTIRDVDGELARALAREKKRRGSSLNQTVLQLLRQALGLDTANVRSDSLGKLAGTWSRDDLSRFERETAMFEQVDEELWKRRASVSAPPRGGAPQGRDTASDE